MPRTLADPHYGQVRAGLRHIAEFGSRRAIYLIAASAVVLVLLVAADVALIETAPPAVQVATVIWYAGPASVTTTPGFTVHTSEKFVLSETCELFCYNFNGVTVSAPFHLVALSIVNQPIQYTNVTIQAPPSSYDGMLGITLNIGPLPADVPSLR